MDTGSRPDWADRLVRLRTGRGWSRRELAEQLRAAAIRQQDHQVPDLEGMKRNVRRWENGDVRPDERYRGLLAELYRQPALAPAPAPWAGSDDERDRVLAAVQDPSRVDSVVVDRLAATLATYRTLEDEAGAAALLAPTLGLTALIDHLGPDVDPATRPRLTGLAAQAAQFAAWLHQDTGQQAAADGWFDRAVAAAIEVDDRAMVASTLSMRAQAAWMRRDPVRAVQLARGAQREAVRVTPGVLALAGHQEARGLALDRDGTAAMRKVDQADALAGRADERREDEPPWIYFDDEAYRVLRRGVVLDELGRHREAADLLSTGLGRLPATMRRDRARYLPLLAAALASPTRPAEADPDRAASVAAQAVPLATATRSAQAARNLRRARRALQPWVGTPAVADLDERLTAAGLGSGHTVTRPAGA